MAHDYGGIDPKVSVLGGESLKDYTRYKRSVEASVLGCDTDEQRKALGPKLYKNLLALNNSISILIEQEGPAKFASADGAKKLLEFLEKERFAKTGFTEMPKVYDKFYEGIRFEAKGSEPMAAYCTAMEVAKRDLEGVDADTKISANTLGYLLLKKSGLDREEKNLVLARADETFDFAKVSTTLKNLFPNGSKARSGGGLRPREPRRWAYQVEDGDEEAVDEDDDDWYAQDAEGYWYEWDETEQNYVAYGDEEAEEDDAFNIEDDVDRTLAAGNTDYNLALVTLRESRDRMN